MSFEPKVNVLLVDDHPENLLALEAILESLGQNLVRATSGAEALRCLLNQDFAVILLDVQMPDMDGFETATLIRQRERSRYTPIIFLTAYSTSDKMVYKGYSLGAVDYLFKPIEPEILKSKVAAFVDLFQKTNEVKRQAAQLAAMNGELRKREEMFRSLSACSPVGIFLTDTLGRCTYINPRYQAIYGMTLEESLGDGWTRAIHPQDRERIIADWYAVSSEGEEYTGEFRTLTPAGIERWVHMSSSPMLCDQGEVIGYVGTIEDITERKQAEEEHIKLIREQTARQEAETANRLKDEFLATLSHELRTPLTSILGWSRLLRQRKFDEKAIARALETIERNASLQAQLIDDILDVSRIIRGKLHLNLCPVNLTSVISTVVNSVRPEAEAKNIQLGYVIEPAAQENGRSGDGEMERLAEQVTPSQAAPSPFLVFGDINRLQQVVWNLLNNALKFTPEGGKVEVRLLISPEFPVLSSESSSKLISPQQPQELIGGELAQAKSSSVLLQVSDTGSGISPDFLPHVFDRFRQADGSITRNQGGLGLGLAIVRYLVEMHGGSVHAESPGVGQGATFTVKLPLVETGTAKKEGERGGWVVGEVEGDREVEGLGSSGRSQHPSGISYAYGTPTANGEAAPTQSPGSGNPPAAPQFLHEGNPPPLAVAPRGARHCSLSHRAEVSELEATGVGVGGQWGGVEKNLSPSYACSTARPNKDATGTPHHLVTSSPHRSPLKDLQVLVVDDDTDTRDFVTTMLQQFGATVTSVASVRQALSAIEKSLPDVLVSDIGMPEEDGYTLIREVRNLEPEIGGHIPAIALTAYVREQDCTRALESGFQMYVTKPVEPANLINAIAKMAQRNCPL
ncbi:hybrid sensor histidine kinase/response regulator [Mastigocladopsis repens]|uniref:hybrid sensor histidine kinase/response regulator n=1 Tax=Mastigocladopsis repens TaxID=221287 RepID=UPI0002F6502B|nr:response regulator [Mastigocladopsis repens]